LKYIIKHQNHSSLSSSFLANRFFVSMLIKYEVKHHEIHESNKPVQMGGGLKGKLKSFMDIMKQHKQLKILCMSVILSYVSAIYNVLRKNYQFCIV